MPLSRSHCRWLLVFCLLGPLCGSAAPTLTVAAGIDPAPWDRLLRKYVDERGLVAYAGWKSEAADLKALDDYLGRLAAVPTEPAKGDEEIAALINAYNAFTIRWILSNYPTESIRKLDNSWGQARWVVGGRTVSLDEIEHRNLRPLYGWRVHATIVCAARSCPPLQNTAFTAENLPRLTERAYRTWLARNDLNRYDPVARRLELSPIFKWFKEDFTGSGEPARIMADWGPAGLRPVFAREDLSIGYLDYHWGLNDQAGLGRDYGQSLWDRLR
jgi:hypothetical protein